MAPELALMFHDYPGEHLPQVEAAELTSAHSRVSGVVTSSALMAALSSASWALSSVDQACGTLGQLVGLSLSYVGFPACRDCGSSGEARTCEAESSESASYLLYSWGSSGVAHAV